MLQNGHWERKGEIKGAVAGLRGGENLKIYSGYVELFGSVISCGS